MFFGRRPKELGIVTPDRAGYNLLVHHGFPVFPGDNQTEDPNHGGKLYKHCSIPWRVAPALGAVWSINTDSHHDG